jgi:sigma-B regulation protein RsbU (phosphoserine phosphatase)
VIEAALPVDEGERLAALRALRVLDTPAEERFDRLTRLLSRMFDVPMAFVSLVDADRQWFKSSCGLSTRQTSRAISFCTHAILADEPLVVHDAHLDERFRNSPLVTGDPYLRFYAGQPLAGPGGHKVGTLCIADRRPRAFSAADRQALREMAELVERELSLVEAVHLQRELLTAREQTVEANRQKAEYLARLVDSQQHLVRELGQAADYVRSLLPAPLDGPVRTRWQFAPSSQLGGDCFGYDWLDADHFAFYLLDVCGHGVGAALLSISVINALRGQTLPATDFTDPAAVLAGLNRAFPMERQDGKFCTVWYGVYDRRDRRLAFASAGHPPGLVVSQDGTVQELGVINFAVGVMPEWRFESATLTLGGHARVYLFSDGVFDVARPDGTMLQRRELIDFLTRSDSPASPGDVWEFVQGVSGGRPLTDDFSFLEVVFPESQ